jgi:hypothetical protein
MSSQDRSSWGFAVICGVVGAVAGGALGWGILYLMLDSLRNIDLGWGLALMVLFPCVGAVAGAIAGTLGGLHISRRIRVGGGRKSGRD